MSKAEKSIVNLEKATSSHDDIRYTGKVSCRLVEDKGCVTRWEARWSLGVITGKKDDFEATLLVCGRRGELPVNLRVCHMEQVMIGIRDCEADYPIGKLDDIHGNTKALYPLLRTSDALMVSCCLADFYKAKPWEDLNMTH